MQHWGGESPHNLWSPHCPRAKEVGHAEGKTYRYGTGDPIDVEAPLSILMSKIQRTAEKMQEEKPPI